MIKSKFRNYQLVGQFVMSAVVIFCSFLFYPIYFGKHAAPLFSELGIIGFGLTVVIPLYIIAQMKLNYNTVFIDTDLKTISFRTFLFQIINAYPFNYFDGYIETTIKDKYGSYKCFYLVKNDRLLYKMSARFYSNIDEIQNGLIGIKFKGKIKYSFLLSIKIALGKPIMTTMDIITPN